LFLDVIYQFLDFIINFYPLVLLFGFDVFCFIPWPSKWENYELLL